MKTLRIAVMLALFLMSGDLRVYSQSGLNTLKDLTELAPVIVLGKVQNVNAEFGDYLGMDNFIFTYVTVAVRFSLKGSVPKQLSVKVHGGRIGDRVLTGKRTFRFSENEEVLLFLEPTKENYFEVYGISGKFSVITKEDGIELFDTTLLKEDEVSRYGHGSSATVEDITTRINRYLAEKGGKGK